MKNSRSLALILPSLLAAHSVGLAAQNGPVFEEVLVTAEKRTESLQNLSQAVTALTAEDVENRQLSSFVDLSAIAPGVNVAKNEGFKTVITIRGIGNEANQNAIANPSVSYHLDGVYVASPFALQTD
ncbi:MAG: TonB-dependent receptor plug domain-containing protein, partial [Luminiphilus sp.]